MLGGLPGPPDWAPRLGRIGLDVVASGADPDTDATLAAAAAAVPYRPVMACGEAAQLSGRSWIVQGGRASDNSFAIDSSPTVLAVDGTLSTPDPNDVAATVLPRVADEPSAWWVAAANLVDVPTETVEQYLTALVKGVQLVRLYLAKQQF